MTTKTITLTDADLETLIELLNEKAMEIEDDGREGHPHAALLNNVARQLRK
jgi:hypothetical protein